MKETKRPWLPALLTGLVLAFAFGCEDPDETGLNIFPPDDYVGATFSDTFTVEMRTLLVDSVETDNPIYSLIGQYVDPEFGRISAATYTQFATDGDNIVFGDDLHLDSIVLTLNIKGVYGRYDDPVELEIFEITQAFPEDDTLYSNDSLQLGGFDYANGFTIDFKSELDPEDQLRIRLHDSLGRKLLNAPVDSLVNNSTFTNFFKGLCIRPKNVAFNNREPGAIFGFDLLSNRTGLAIYYHDGTRVKSYAFNVDEDSRRFTRITRNDHTTKLMYSMLADTIAPLNTFAEAGALVKTYIKFPYLTSLAPVGVNRADVIVHVEEQYLGTGERFIPPGKLHLYYADSTGKQEKGIPVSFSEFNYITNTYEFPLTDNIMAIINGQRDNTGFILVPSDKDVTVNRVVLGGPSHPTLRPELRIVLTNIPE